MHPHDTPFREIPLSGKHGRGKVALVDAADYDWLMQWKWYCHATTDREKTDYARGTVNGKHMLMHRLITGAPPGVLVDHRDGDGLNNCRHNLRRATNGQNVQNSQKRAGDATSSYKGVCKAPRQQGWVSQVHIDGKIVRLGRYLTQREAAIAYNEAALKHYGEFAHLNDIPDQLPPDDVQVELPVYTSVFLGVSWHQRIGKWAASTGHNRKKIHIGYFSDELDAAIARDEFVKKLNNPRIRLNFTQ